MLFESETVVWASALSYDETLLAVTHTENGRAGDTFSTAVRVVDAATGAMLAEQWDGQGRRLDAVGFAPRDGDQRLILHHQRQGQDARMVWDPADGTELHPSIDREGETTACWYPDASALLMKTQRHGRDRLSRYDLLSDSAAVPWSLLDQSGTVPLPQPGEMPDHRVTARRSR